MKIEITEKQAMVTAEALEMYSRHLAGQFNYSILPPVLLWNKEVSDRNILESKINEVKNIIFPELACNESYGIGTNDQELPIIAEHKNIAYECYKVIRYHFEKDKEGYSVYKELPMLLSEEPLMKIENVDVEVEENRKDIKNEIVKILAKQKVIKQGDRLHISSEGVVDDLLYLLRLK